MGCNKEEAMRAMETAEQKMRSNDFEGARQDAMKANNLYPELENLNQMLSICDVYCSAQIRNLRLKDWYGVLQVEKWADELTIKKQFRQLALVLHPDKNRFPGADGAFKLLCEANAVLSNPAKRSSYDNKIKDLPKPTSENCPNHQSSGDYQFNQQHGAQNSNNSNVFEKKDGTDQAHSEIGVKNVKVPSMSCPGSPEPGTQRGVGSESINVENAAENLKTKETVNVNVNSSCGIKVGEPADGDVVRGESKNIRTKSWNRRRKLELESRYGSDIDKEDVSEQETVNLNASSLRRKKVAVSSNGDSVCGESKNTRSKRRNKRRKLELESNDGSDTDIEDVTEQENLGDAYLTPEVARRSSRRRHRVSFKEPDENDYARPHKRSHTAKEANGKEHRDAVDGEDSKHSFPTVPASSKSRNKSKESLKNKNDGCDKGRIERVTRGRPSALADVVDIETDSDSDSLVLKCSDPEFSDFDKLREESKFCVNQFWAFYDTTSESMPRFYAKVKKVRSSPFELDITWLQAVAIDDSWEKWIDEELPVGCGSFKLGETDKVSGCLSLSHQVHCEKGTKDGYFSIYPREGEVWALYRDWDISWSSNLKNVKKFRYEIVEVLSDFAAGVGIKVVYLDKITGFVSLFRRAVRSETSSFLIKPSELYKFSHYVPSFKMTGDERLGVPIGSFELDPASLPIESEDLHVPSKVKIVSRDEDEDYGLPSSLPRYCDGKGKYVAVSSDDDSGAPSPLPRYGEEKGKDVAASSDEDSGVPSPLPRYNEGKGKYVAVSSDEDTGVPSPLPRYGEGEGKDVAASSDEDSGVPSPLPRYNDGKGKDVAVSSDEDTGVPSPLPRYSEGEGKDVAASRDEDSGVRSPVPRYNEGKGKDVASGSKCNPDKIVDLEGSNEDASQDGKRLSKWVFRPGLLGSSYFSFGPIGLNFFRTKKFR